MALSPRSLRATARHAAKSGAGQYMKDRDDAETLRDELQALGREATVIDRDPFGNGWVVWPAPTTEEG